MIDRVRRVSGLLLLFVCVRLTDTDPAGAQPTPSTSTSTSTSTPSFAPAPAPTATPAPDPDPISTSSPTPAQPPATAPDPPISAVQFSRLQRTGTSELFVYGSQSRVPIQGFLLRLTARDLTMLVNGQEETIPLASVRRIDRRGDSIWNGFAIGAAVGVFTWIKIYREWIPPDGITWVVGLPALIGAGIDALWVGETTVYRASSSSRAAARAGAPRGRPWPPRVVFTLRF
jgi:hypothetical protein